MKRILLSILCFLAIALNANAETYTHKFAKDQLKTAGGEVTLSDVVWNATEAVSIGWNNTKGIQFGSTDACNTFYQLSTQAFAGCKIRSITVNSSTAAKGDAKLTIKVGNETSGEISLSTSAKDYTHSFDNATGEITISWTAANRAYYVKSITIDYAPDASTFNVPAPEFKTTPGIYANSVKVIAETTEQTAAIYYTTDGTIPSYEDYVNETGTTNSSRTWQIICDLTSTTTIKAMSVIVDGESVYKSEVSEAAFYVSPHKPYILATAIESGNKYAMIAADSAACHIYDATATGNLPTRAAIAPNDKFIETVECAGYTFTAIAGEYTIQDILGRYIVQNGTEPTFKATAEKPSTGATWSVTISNEGYATISNAAGYAIYFNEENATYGCYQPSNTTTLHLPRLYKQREYPEYTILPASLSSIDKFEYLTISCNEGIGTSNLKATASGFEIEVPLTCTQIDEKTLKFTPAAPITTKNNTNLQINITGDIILNPGGIQMALPINTRYGVKTLASYTIIGDAEAARIIEVSPANGSTVEELSYFIFTVSYYADHSTDGALQPRLHLEGSETLIPLEKTPENGSGGFIKMDQVALKTSEPVLENGIYILEIPTGYFTDGNGKEIAGVTLRYIVKNETAIDEVLADETKGWTIHNACGIKILETTNATELNALPSGFYIVNGIKVFKK